MINLLILGGSGTVGHGVTKVCLAAAHVTSVRAITRRPLSTTHPKLESVTHQDFTNYTQVASAFRNIDACLYCLGKSVSQVSSEPEYKKLTYDFALAAAAALRAASPNAVFHFVSGQGAHLDSRFMWARVKAETERDLLAQFAAVCWRPGAIDGEPSESSPNAYRYLRMLYPMLRPLRGLYVSSEQIGSAMLQAIAEKLPPCIIENREVRDLADRFDAATRQR